MPGTKQHKWGKKLRQPNLLQAFNQLKMFLLNKYSNLQCLPSIENMKNLSRIPESRMGFMILIFNHILK